MDCGSSYGVTVLVAICASIVGDASHVVFTFIPNASFYLYPLHPFTSKLAIWGLSMGGPCCRVCLYCQLNSQNLSKNAREMWE